MQAAPVATTPEVSTPQFAVDGQPQQPVGGMPEGQQLEPEGIQPEAPVQDQWFLKAETGTVYKTAEAAAAGIAEKDRFIERLLSERQQWQSQQPPAPQTSPQDAYASKLTETAARIEQRMLSMQKYQGFDRDAIKQEAELQAIAVLESQEISQQAFQQELQRQQWEAKVNSTPELQSQLAKDVFDRHMQMYGKPPMSPEHHLDLVHAEMYRQGIPRSQAGGTSAVNGAMQNMQQQRQQIFGNVAGGGQMPPAEVLPPHVQESVNLAIKQGLPEAEIQRIKATAMQMNPSRFNKGGFR